MSVLDDVLKALDRWSEWKKMREAPARIDALEARLSALEKAPPEKAGDPAHIAANLHSDWRHRSSERWVACMWGSPRHGHAATVGSRSRWPRTHNPSRRPPCGTV
jgi:hypothetical protein